MWQADLADKVRGYPKTQAAYDKLQARCKEQNTRFHREGKLGRNGVPDGWGRQKHEINRIVAACTAEAKEIMDELKETGRFMPDNVESEIVLGEAFKVVLAEKHTDDAKALVPLYGVRERLTAMRMIWEVVQKKPLARSEVGLTKAEDFLAMLAAPPTE